MDYGLRHDGKTKKGTGYLGEVVNSNGNVMTEFTVGVDIGDGEEDIPTLTPNLTRQQIHTLMNLKDGQDIPRDIVDRAVEHAQYRKFIHRSVFADAIDDKEVPTIRKQLGLD